MPVLPTFYTPYLSTRIIIIHLNILWYIAWAGDINGSYQIGLCEGVEPRGRKHIINADWIIFSNVYSEILYLRLFVYKEISVLSRSFSWYIWRIFWCIGSHQSHMPRSQDQDRPTSRPDRTCADRIRDILVLNPQHHCNKKKAEINVKLQPEKSANKDGIFFRFF